ncbi:DUF2971 domain-containing protein [Pseudomonas bubulae]|uniref:DUF2971 domain-containing protein n=1 Tax=Pseudomonas bubulae TaxID=2316085 RepID=UPI002B1DD217|nr:DUF2971 domain-containing protein [Pseudomonas bubulae]
MDTDYRKKKLYRIMDFDRVVQIFEKKELYFGKPIIWDDPYESILSHAKSDHIYSQCWSFSGVSDAMWRIYSKNGMGVRISTTFEKLDSLLKTPQDDGAFMYRLRPVKYVSPIEIRQEAIEVAHCSKINLDLARVVDLLYMKRSAFSHEEELRATIFFPGEEDSYDAPGVTIPIDPNDFIENILLDPRAPEELIKSFEHYFRNVLGYKNTIKRSELYKAPDIIEIKSKVVSLEEILETKK